MNSLNKEIINHWKQLRRMTYDFIEVISDEDLGLTLPFDKSQKLGYQLWCITGTQETYIDYIMTGKWSEWSCSLNKVEGVTKDIIAKHLKRADRDMIEMLSIVDLSEPTDDNETPLSRYLTLVEHESHHQGQIINFIYAHNLQIPTSWKSKWNLTK